MRCLALVFGLCIGASAWGATFTVVSLLDFPDSNTGDGVCNSTQSGASNDCTLRAAIEQANASAGADTIAFNFTSGTSALVITLTSSALPTINDTLTIDGRTVPGYAVINNNPLQSRPRIFLNGSNTGGGADGFRFSTSGADGSAVYGIGIVYFPDAGIELNGTDGVFLDANWIGLHWDGSTGAGNVNGVEIINSNGVLVGTSALGGIGNLLSDNSSYGVLASGTFISIFDNHFGITSVGLALGNGVAINILGGDAYVADNNIRNSSTGLILVGPDAEVDGNRFRGNGIGMQVAGNNAIINDNELSAHSGDVIKVTSTDNATISNNIIFDGQGSGIVIGGGANTSDGNNVTGNVIYDIEGAAGVHLIEGTNNEVFDNNIYDMNARGIQIQASGNFIAGNRLGFKEGPLQVLPIAENGMVVQGDSNRIGQKRDLSKVSNTIATGASDWMDGIDVWFGFKFNYISGNFIGALPDGTELGVGGHGVRIDQGGGNIIQGNTIGFALNGVHIVSTNAIATVCGNEIGVIRGATPKDIGNRGSGIYLDGNFGKVQHDPTCAMFVEEQYVGFNDIGITVNGHSNRIQHTFIGGSHSSSFPNDTVGIHFTGSSVGNDVIGIRVYDNGSTGIVMDSTVGETNTISGNTLFRGNGGGLGIDLGNNGITPNDANDPDTGPNKLMNFPVISQVTTNPGEVTVSYRLDYDDSNGTDASVYFYVADGNTRQGEWFLGVQQNLDAPNTLSMQTFTVPLGVLPGPGYIVARAEDIDGNSSEFSATFAFTVPAPSDVLFKDSFED